MCVLVRVGSVRLVQAMRVTKCVLVNPISFSCVGAHVVSGGESITPTRQQQLWCAEFHNDLLYY
jgi:hypothetical protein